MYYIIYKTTCIVNNKIYIGQHSTDNLNDEYLGSGALLKEDIKLFGRDKFKREILFTFDNWNECNIKESEIVDSIFVARLDTYNCRVGGYCIGSDKEYNYSKAGILGQQKLQQKMSEDAEFRDEIIEKRRHIAIVNNHINHMIRYDWTGKRHRAESKKKIGLANSIHQQGKGNSQYGTCWIYNEDLKENKKINKTDLDSWLEKGWRKGRKIKSPL